MGAGRILPLGPKPGFSPNLRPPCHGPFPQRACADAERRLRLAVPAGERRAGEDELAEQRGFHATFTQTGTFSAVLDQGGTSSGRFTTWGNFNTDTTGQQANGTFIFSLTVKSGVGAGTHFNETAHFTGPVDAEGNPIFSLAKVAFDNVRCH